MTRREFLTLAGIVPVVCTGLRGIRKALPCRIARAAPLSKYPGTVVLLGDLHMQSKWSG